MRKGRVRRTASARKITTALWIDARGFSQENIKGRFAELFAVLGLPDDAPTFTYFETK